MTLSSVSQTVHRGALGRRKLIPRALRAGGSEGGVKGQSPSPKPEKTEFYKTLQK